MARLNAVKGMSDDVFECAGKVCKGQCSVVHRALNLSRSYRSSSVILTLKVDLPF